MAASVDKVFIGPAPRLAVSFAGSGPLVLFLHGIRGHRGDWSRQLAFFSAHFTAAAWDARGFGDSDDYAAWLQFHHLVGDVLRVIEPFKAKSAHLVGPAVAARSGRPGALPFPHRMPATTKDT